MKRTEAATALREFLRRTPARGVKSLSIFGSVARDDAGVNSDIDVLVDFESAPTFIGFMELKCALEDFLGLPGDLVDRAALRENWRAIIEQEAFHVA
jgi:predicted nucleotidyltransferase